MDKTALEAQNRDVIDEFRQRNGAVGGPYENMTLLLLHSVGARSGTSRLNPMAYQSLQSDRFAVFATNGGADTHPDWYHNVVANSQVTIELGSSLVAARARTASGNERQAIWERQIERFPLFTDLAAATTREIPVVIVEPTGHTLDLAQFTELIAQDNGLCVVSTSRPDATIQSSVVNAGVIQHPTTGLPVVAFVALGDARKLDNLRHDPTITVVVRAGWAWAAVEGSAELIGPDDGAAGTHPDALRRLLRQIFTAAGGTHDDWAAFDATMATERRTAVFVRPRRTYPNAPQ